MSSSIKIEKTCIFCKNKFIARTLTTKYCSHKCNQKHYKLRKREEKINNFKEREKNENHKPISNIKLSEKEYLSVSETAATLCTTTRNIYRLIQKDVLKSYKVGGRRLIKKMDIDKFFE